MAAMAKEWAMPCGKIFAARGGRCDHSTTDVRGAQAPHVDGNPKGGSDPLDAGGTMDRSPTRMRVSLRSTETPGAGRRARARTLADREHGIRLALAPARVIGDPCHDHQSSDDL
ncbi:hypothetical protein [Burkholderia anthina]|uniref:hypothetical protein n=1 Tax=Burkholderia anthina TaxID=179879 RepID=UPI00158CBFC2|nr:hypothetical protein [Burkholderia anthina]